VLQLNASVTVPYLSLQGGAADPRACAVSRGSLDGVLEVFRKLGPIQFDPVAVASYEPWAW
jgi:hypothetical protein